MNYLTRVKVCGTLTEVVVSDLALFLITFLFIFVVTFITLIYYYYYYSGSYSEHS
jgi:hypothetical protein